MTKILVTGGNGQLGRELQNTATGGAGEGGEFSWIFTDIDRLDITDTGAAGRLFGSVRPDVIVNCAAWTDVDRAETEREGAFRVNRDAVAVLSQAARRADAALVHVSTDFVFDGAAHTPYTEQDTPSPLNVYGESKLAGERAVRESECRGTVIRTSWLYSPYGRNFVKSILGAASGNAEIRVVADQRGNPTAADGLAAAIVRMIPQLVSDRRPAETYHYCDTGTVSRADFAAEIIRQAGLSCRVVPVSSSEYPAAASRPAYSALDTAKIARDFGIVPRPWREALHACLRELRIKNQKSEC